jgi:hypothetical protein
MEDIEDVKQWIAEHDGKITAFWNQQHDWNKVVDVSFRDIYGRINSLEKKIMWFAGAGAAIGAIVGALLPKLISVIG